VLALAVVVGAVVGFIRRRLERGGPEHDS